MAFNYKKSEKQSENGMQWTSYSDLFMCLSVVFLLMYVVASVRTGSNEIVNKVESKRLEKENEDLKEQLRVYNTLKDDYLEKGASEEETESYQKLMSKLNLLQEENGEEAKKLREQANDNDQKKRALNKYQQMIRNIIDSNMLSQARIQSREKVIKEKDVVIQEKQTNLEEQLTDIRKLEREVSDRKVEISKSKSTIAQIESSLQKKTAQLQNSFKRQKISKAAMAKQIKKIQNESQSQIAELQQKTKASEAEVTRASAQLAQVSTDLQSAQSTIEQQRAKQAKLLSDLKDAGTKAQQEIDRLAGEFDVKRRLDQQRFQNALNKERLSKAEMGKRQKAFADKMAADKANHSRQLASLQQEKGQVEGQLAQAREQLLAKKKLAEKISKNFAASGIDAEVNQETGDVVISFGKQYFDTGRADLKPAMIQKIEKAMPVYSKSLFEDPKVASKISSVEIIGFASPTYKGKYIDPKSLDPSDRAAVEFNLDLSFQRAKSIFTHIFDTQKMQYPDQKRLLPLVKVTGRSFLAEGAEGRGLASGLGMGEYCKKFDCEKSQKVIIKFNVEK